MYPKFVEYVRIHKPTAIVCTHITAANVAVSARMILGETFPIVCVPTDYEVEGLWPHASTDLFCVANEHMAETLRPRHVPEERILITGIPPKPAFRCDYDRLDVRERFGLDRDKRVVLFLAGASLPRPYVHFREAIDVLLPYLHSFDDMQVVIVAGKDAEYAARLRRSVEDYRLSNVVVLDFVDDMAALMSASDLIVCKSGGLTVTECLCAKTPMLLLGRAYGQEKANTALLTSAGAALHVTTARELVDELRQIEDHPQMTDAVLVNASFMRRPDAALDIARATLRLVNSEKHPGDKIYKKHFMHFYWGDKPAHIR
jgi:processive 1,2-diacylglycerol beta-glucosyltransferase